MDMKHFILFLKLMFWLVLCQLPGLVGAGAVRPHLEWFHTLQMPPLMPPDKVFGLMWGVLYVLLGLAAFWAFRNGLKGARKALILFIVQLALNAWWTPVFFADQNPGAALLLLAAMLSEGLWLAQAFWRKNRTAAWLLLPYGLWLLFAGYLNAGIWVLNL